jgi:peptidoglycan/LPS O-acetylase OafA/YrhL
MQRRSRLSHIPALDGVRGIAVVGVLFFHAGHLSGGFLGVDLFFTLSGFLITSLLIAEWREHGTIRLRAFWARRARRLLPALFIVLTLAALYAAVLAGDTELGRLRGDAFASLFYVSNWWQIGHRQSYWDIFTAGSPLAHMWSLAIEEQFYVVWPLLFFAVIKRAGRRALPWLFATTAVLTAASAVAMAWLHHAGSDPTRVYEGSDTRAASILVGCLAAMLVAGRGAAVGRPARVAIETAGCVAAIGIAWSWFTIDGLRSNDLFEGGLFLHSFAGAVLITAAAHPLSPVLGRLLSLRPLRFIGTISYGIYLYHLPVYVALTPERAHLRGWPLDGVHLAVTLAIAVLSYRFVEQPIRRGALSRRRAPRALAAAVVAVTAALLASTAGAVSVSASSLGPAGAPTLDDPTTTTTTTTTTTASAADGTTSTTAAGLLAPRRVSVVGDSVAWTIGVGLDAIKSDRDIAVQNEGVWGCGISRSDGKVRLKEGQIVTEAAACPQWPQRWADDLASFHPDDVVLVLGAWDLADRMRNGSWTHPCAAGFDEWWAGEFDEALRVLGTAGATVHVTTVPFLRSNVLGVSEAETDKRVDCLNTVIRSGAATRSVDVIDLAGWVCPEGVCVEKVDTTVLRADGVHYDGPGGPIVAGWLLDRLEPRVAPIAVTSTSSTTTTSTPLAATTTSTEVPTPSVPALRTLPDAPAAGTVAARSRPLRVLFVGDSYLFDLQWGARAALEAAGVVVDTMPHLGFNLAITQWDWKALWQREVTRFKPDVVVAVWGIIDVQILRVVGIDNYQRMLDEAIDILAARHATVVLFGLAASVNDDRGSALTFNDVWSAVPARRAGVIYVDPDPILSPHGVPEATFATTAGTVRVRKPDGDHFCPGGSLRFGRAMLELTNAWWAVPSPTTAWETGDWLAEPAYVDPPGACPAV